MRADQFYTSNNLEKFPNHGKLNMCKQCVTAHVDNWNPETYLWILEDLDVPYIPEQWASLMNSYARNGKKMTGMTILGRYLSKMKLNQYKEYRWKEEFFLRTIYRFLWSDMSRQQYNIFRIHLLQKAPK